jgi:hypothetical protein
MQRMILLTLAVLAALAFGLCVAALMWRQTQPERRAMPSKVRMDVDGRKSRKVPMRVYETEHGLYMEPVEPPTQ